MLRVPVEAAKNIRSAVENNGCRASLLVVRLSIHDIRTTKHIKRHD
jgi:hypothetical protein